MIGIIELDLLLLIFTTFFMQVQGIFTIKINITNSTTIYFTLIVNINVCLQILIAHESLTTNLAWQFLYLPMPSRSVPAERSFVGKRFTTSFTNKGTFFGWYCWFLVVRLFFFFWRSFRYTGSREICQIFSSFMLFVD